MKILCRSKGPLSLGLFHDVFLPSNKAHCISVNGATSSPFHKTAASILTTGEFDTAIRGREWAIPHYQLGWNGAGLGDYECSQVVFVYSHDTGAAVVHDIDCACCSRADESDVKFDLYRRQETMC